MAKTPKKKKDKIVYVAMGIAPVEGEPFAGNIFYSGGYSKKQTNWYKYPISFEKLEEYASMYDYVLLEGIGCYIG